MSQFADVVSAWVEKLKDIPGLEDATEHGNVPWSMERLQAGRNERHIAVWPEGEPEGVVPDIAGSPPADLATQRYTILVWEDASEDAIRRIDNEDANLEWLDLYEAIRDELYDLNNRNLGDPQSNMMRYQGGAFDTTAGLRVMEIRFTVQVYHSFHS